MPPTCSFVQSSARSSCAGTYFINRPWKDIPHRQYAESCTAPSKLGRDCRSNSAAFSAREQRETDAAAARDENAAGAAARAAAAAAAADVLLQLDGGLEDDMIIAHDDDTCDDAEDFSAFFAPELRLPVDDSPFPRPGRGSSTPIAGRETPKGRDKQRSSHMSRMRDRLRALVEDVKAAQERGSWADASKVASEARSSGLRLDGRVHTALIHAALNLREVDAALGAFADMRADGFTPKIALYNKAIGLCGRQGRWQDAVNVLRDAQFDGAQSGRNSGGGDVVTYTVAMVACRNAGAWEQALSLIEEMQAAGIKPDQVAFGTAVSCCATGGLWQRARTLLAEMKRAGLKPDVIAYSSAVKACGKKGRWQEALELLQEMEETAIQPNLITYTGAMEACGRSGQWEKAIWLLSQVRDKRLQPDVIILNAVMEALARAGETEKALALLQTMRPVPPSAADRVRKSPARDGRDTRAVKRHPRADAFTWSSAMTACIEGGHWAIVPSMLQDMRADGVEPNIINYNLVMKALARGGKWERAVSLLEEMSAEGMCPDKWTYCSAIEACGRGGSWERAVSLLDDMRRQGLTPDEQAYRALACTELGGFMRSTVIAACDRGGAWDVALMMLDEARDIAPGGANVFSYTAAISACGKAGQWEKSVSLLDTMRQDGVVPNGVTFRAALLALENAPAESLRARGEDVSVPCAAESPIANEAASSQTRRGHNSDDVMGSAMDTRRRRARGRGVGAPWKVGLSLLEDMANGQGGVLPVPRDFAAVLTAACFGEADWSSIQKILDMMETCACSTRSQQGGVDGRDAEAAPFTAVGPGESWSQEAIVQGYNYVIRSCAQAGGADVALGLMEEMYARSITPDASSYSSAMVACDLVGRWRKAVALLDDMRARAGMEPDLVCYNCAVKACGSGGEWRAALAVVEEMRSNGIAPDEITYSSAISACSNAGEVNRALSLLQEMKAGGVPAGLIVHNAVLGACDKGSDWPSTLRVLGEMDRRGIALDAISYAAAISSAEKAGEWTETLRLYDQLRSDMVKSASSDEADRYEESTSGQAVESFTRHGGELPIPRFTLAALTACARGGDFKRALNILRETEMKAGKGTGDGIRLHLGQGSSLAFNAALVACAKGAEAEAAQGRDGGWREAVEMLGMMGSTPDLTSYGRAITACGFGGNVEACVDLLSGMLQRGMTPTLDDYHSSLRACATRRRADAAQEILDSMSSECVQPDARCYLFAAEAFRYSESEEDPSAKSRIFSEMARELDAKSAGLRNNNEAIGYLRELGFAGTEKLKKLLEAHGGSEATDFRNI